MIHGINIHRSTSQKVQTKSVSPVLHIPAAVFNSLKNGNVMGQVAVFEGSKIVRTPHGDIVLEGLLKVPSGTVLMVGFSDNDEILFRVLNQSMSHEELQLMDISDIHADDIKETLSVPIGKIVTGSLESEIGTRPADKWVDSIVALEAKIAKFQEHPNPISTFKEIYLLHASQYQEFRDILEFTKHLSWQLFPIPMNWREQEVLLYTYIKKTAEDEARHFKVELNDSIIGPIAIDIMMKNSRLDFKVSTKTPLDNDLRALVETEFSSVCQGLSFSGSIIFRIDEGIFSRKFLAELLREHCIDRAMSISA